MISTRSVALLGIIGLFFVISWRYLVSNFEIADTDSSIQLNKMEEQYKFLKTVLTPGRILKFQVQSESEGKVVTYGQFLKLIQSSGEFRQNFFNVLTDDNDFQAYFFETPKVKNLNIDQLEFEFVLIKAPSLVDVSPDSDAFSQHFAKCKKGAATFWNLGHDALLVAPCPQPKDKDHKKFTHLAEFMRRVSANQVHEYWIEVAREMEKLVEKRGDSYTWLSTCGTGVFWLHMRMDSYPKYYSYGPYKTF